MEADPAEWRRLRDAFDEALQSGQGTARPFTPGSGSDDPELQREIEELLQHLEKARDLLPLDGMAASFPPGYVLSDRYRILCRLGSGGMGDVYEVEDQHLNEIVALKTLHLENGNPNLAVEMLRREVRNARRVVHPNICRSYDIGYYRDEMEVCAYLTMERLHGQTLKAYLERGACRTVDEALKLAKQMCAGLHAAHEQSIAHGDLKPQNMFVTVDEQRLVILDFGLSRQSKNLEMTSNTVSGMCMGTPAYLAPERFAGRAASFASDLYSVGIILREIMTATSSRGVNFPSTWEQTTEVCLRVDPAQRPQSARQVFDLLCDAKKDRWRWMWSVPGAAVVAVLLGLWGWKMHARPATFHAGTGATSLHPGAKEYLQMGSYYLNRQTRRSVDESIDQFRMGVALDPSNAVAQARFGRALIRKYEISKDPQWLGEAEKVLAVAEKLAPEAGEVLLTAGMVERDHGHLGEAVAKLKRSSAADRANGEAWKQMAITFDSSGNVLDAQAAYEQGIAADSSNWSLYTDFGLFYYAHGQFQKAESQFLTAESLAPDSPAVFADLGGLYLAEGRLDDAQRTLKRALDLEPTAAISMNLGTVYLRQEKIADAVRLYRKACDLSPNDYRTWTNLGGGYKRLGKEAEANSAYARAVVILHRSLATTPKDPHLLSELALYAAVVGNAAEARATTEQALQAAPQNPKVYVQAATVEELLGARQAALHYLERAFELGASVKEIEGIAELAALRSDPAFEKFRARWQTSAILAR